LIKKISDLYNHGTFRLSKQKKFIMVRKPGGPRKRFVKYDEPETPKTWRLNQYIAQSGLCSRRKADEYIREGRIKLNDQVVTNLGVIVKSGDRIKVDDKPIVPEKNVYILMNKPKDVITTLNDPEGRKTVLDILGEAATERIFPVGRLDRNTTGLLLLTNDGDLAQKLSHPSAQVSKIYEITLDRPVLVQDLNKLRAGFTLEDGFIKPDAVEYNLEKGKNTLGIIIHSGKNRIVRRMLESLNYKVKKLDRTEYAGLTKKDVPRGKWRHLKKIEVINLKHFINTRTQSSER